MSAPERLNGACELPPVDGRKAPLTGVSGRSDGFSRSTDPLFSADHDFSRFSTRGESVFAAPAAPVAGPNGPLDTKGATFPQSLPGEAKTVSRWRLKHQIAGLIRHATPDGGRLPGVCKCGTARPETERVRVVRRDEKAGFRGTLMCGSPWLCPTCAPRRAVQRVERLERVFDAAERKGWTLVFVTLTASHRSTDTLSALKALVSGSSRRARQGRAWNRLAGDHQIEGVINGPEVTISRAAGWHYHQHLALLVGTSDHAAAEAAGFAIRDRYLSMIRAAGGRALKRGQDVQVVWRREDVQSYLAKGSAAWEVGAAGVGKEGRGESLSPWDLAALAGRGDPWATAKFLEYVREMPGTRSCVVTKSIAEKLGLEADDGEAELVEEPEDIEVGEIARATWHSLVRRGHVADVLHAVNRGVQWPEIERCIQRWTARDGPT